MPQHHPQNVQPPGPYVPQTWPEPKKRSSISSQATADGAPHWAELKTKAGKDRKRLPLACIACRRKKIRCSGEKPACKHCLKSRTPCVYKVSARKAGPRTDYMAMLDKRLKRMEDRVIKIIPKEEFQTMPDVGRAAVKPSQTQAAEKTSDRRKRTAQEAFGGPDLDKWAGVKPTLPRTADATTRYPQPQPPADAESDLLKEGWDDLPSFELQQHLAETYFEHVYGQSYYLLHKPSFMRKLAQGAVAPVLVLAVCAVSARFSDHPDMKKLNPPSFLRGEQWSDKAREIAQRRFDYPNITIMIVLLLLGLHEFGTCQGGRSWMLGGMAHRMAYALQLHKDLPYDPCGDKDEPLSFIDREIRRRTMWGCFIMDRFNSSGTNRPMFACEEYMHLQLPVKEHNFEHDIPAETETLENLTDFSQLPPDELAQKKFDMLDTIGLSAYMVRVIALFGRIAQYFNLGGRERDPEPAWSDRSGFARLQKEVEGFQKLLPDSLKYSEDNLRVHHSEHAASQFLYLHIAYQVCHLFLNKYAIPNPNKSLTPKDQPASFVPQAKEKAIAAGAAISTLLTKTAHHKVMAPFTGFCAYLSSTVQIPGMFSKDAEMRKRSEANVKVNIGYLGSMIKFWGPVHSLNDNVKEMYRNFADLASKGTATPDGRLDDRHYGDWYDRYPHGVVSRQTHPEPLTHIKTEAEDAAMAQKEDLQSFDQFETTLSPKSQAKEAASKVAQKSLAAKKSRRNTATKEPRRSSKIAADMPASAGAADRSFDSVEMRTPVNGFPESYDRSPVVAQPRPSMPQQQQHQHGYLHQQPQHQPPHPQHPLHTRHPIQMTSQPSDPYPLSMQSSYMPQEDGQIPFPAYPGMDPALSGIPDMHNDFWNIDYTHGDQSWYFDPNEPWLTPFNVNPPDWSAAGSDSFMSNSPMMTNQQEPHMPSTGRGPSSGRG